MTPKEALAPDRASLDPYQRQQHLSAVTDAYFAGEVDVDTYLEARDTYGIDWRRLIDGLVAARMRANRRPSLWDRLRGKEKAA